MTVESGPHGFELHCDAEGCEERLISFPGETVEQARDRAERFIGWSSLVLPDYADDHCPDHVPMAAPSADEQLRRLGVSPELSAAYDILTDDGYPAEKAAEILVKAEQMHRDGKITMTVEQYARHMVKLRKAIR